jgi:putative polyhydroxyalkanoate system protein
MPDIEIRRTHGVTLQDARAAAERIAAELEQRFGLRGEWQGDTFNFKRSGVTGFLAVGAQDVHLSVTLGLLLKAMRDSIERAAVHKLDAVFPTRR